MQGVLLLNASFEPLGVISWKKAVCLFFSGKVEVVEEYENKIRSVTIAIKAPSIVRLLRFVKLGKRRPPLSRINVFARDQFQCQYCGTNLRIKEATLDHLLPRSRGGTTNWLNIVCACRKCNIKKGGRTPAEAHMLLRRNPFVPDWLPVIELKFNGEIPQPWRLFVKTKRNT